MYEKLPQILLIGLCPIVKFLSTLGNRTPHTFGASTEKFCLHTVYVYFKNSFRIIAIVLQPVIMQQQTSPNLGPNSTRVVCSHCGNQVLTSTRSRIGLLTFIAVGILLLLGLFTCLPLLCFWVPFVIPSLKDVEHVCPACHKVIGIA